jgi:hypothetical protein
VTIASRAVPRAVPVIEASLLTLWLGAAIFFAAVVAPAAFAVLPTAALAGALIGRLLPPLFIAGTGVGIVVLALELRWQRERTAVRVLPAGVVLSACAVAQFAVGGRIQRLRAGVRAPIGALAPGDPRRIAFARLHALSVGALGAAMFAAGTGVVLTVKRSPAARA